MEKTKILPIYPATKGVNGVMTFVRDLYEDKDWWSKNNCEVLEALGIWFDLKVKNGKYEYPKEKVEAETIEEKNEVKKIAKKYIEEKEPDIIHVNVYAIDKEILKFLKDYKEEKRINIVYTVHSLALQDFIRSPEDQNIFELPKILYKIEDLYIKNNEFLSGLLELSKKFLDLEDADKRVLEILKNEDKINIESAELFSKTPIEEIEKNIKNYSAQIQSDFEKFIRAVIRTYMMSQQYYLFNLADKIVCVSEFIKESIQKNYPEIENEKLITINNGTDMLRVYEENKSKIENSSKMWREQYHKKDDFIIMYVGRVTPSKGVDDLVDAFHMLIKDEKYKDKVFLYLSGPGAEEYYGKLKNEGKWIYGKMFYFFEATLPKPLSEYEKNHMAIIYKIADVIVYPSLYEPFGLVPLEALSCEVPVIVRKIDNLENFAKDNIVYSFRTKNELVNLIKYIIENRNDVAKKVEESREIIREKYSLERMRREYLNVFNQLKK
ncbi:MAG: glycosyltransferase [Nanoarchaeales archaeon]